MSQISTFARANIAPLKSRGLLVLLVLLVLGPILSILVLSFDVSEIGEPFRFGFDAWLHVFVDTDSLNSAVTSFILAVRVPVGLLLAVFIAWLLVRVKIPGSSFFETAFWFSYFLPMIPMVTSWSLLLDEDYGLVNSFLMQKGWFSSAPFDLSSSAGIMWVHLTIQTVPVLVILLLPAMRMLDRSFDDAANIAGASALRIFRTITIPLMLPAILVAGIAASVKALESFEVEQILGVTAGVSVLSTRVYEFITQSPPQLSDAMVLSFAFLVLLLAIGTIHQFVQNKMRSRSSEEAQIDPVERSSYSRRCKWLGTMFVSFYLATTILAPLAMLVLGSFMKLFGFFHLQNPWTTRHWETVLGSQELQKSVLSTLGLGVITALPAALLFAALAWNIRHLPYRSRQAVSILTWLPWALPGIVLGIGILQLTLHVPGLRQIHGTIFPLMLALIIKEIPIGVHLMQVSLNQTNKDAIEAAQMTTAGSFMLFRRIILPLNLPALILVFLLVFAATIRDVGTIILIAPPDIQTLSIMVFKYASITEFEAASVVGVLLAGLLLGVAIITHFVANRKGYGR